MESFADVYRDLLLQRLKYEHLCDACRKLLKTWPRHDSSGRPTKGMGAAETSAGEERRKTDKYRQREQDKNQMVARSKTAATDSPMDGDWSVPSQSQDLQLLEDILSKAQRIRASLPADGAGPNPKQNTRQPTKPLPSVPKRGGKGSSTVQAASVYGNARATKKHALKVTSKAHLTTSKVARVKPKAGVSPVVGASCRQKFVLSSEEIPSARRSTSEPFLDPRKEAGSITNAEVERPLRPSEAPPSDTLAPLYAQVEELTLKGETDGSVAIATTLKDTSSGRQGVPHEGKEVPGFKIKDNGHHLSMPPKYYRLHRAVTKLTGQLQDRHNGGEAAAEYFCARLTAKEPAGAAKTIQLLLAREECVVLRDQLQSLTPQELAVSERTRWQDILRIKTKLESIEQGIQELHERLTSEEHPIGPPPDNLQDPLLTAPPPHVYNSLEDWQALALSELRLRLQSCEIAILKFCTEVVLPRIDQMQKTDSKHLLALVQAMYDLAGLDSKPVFLAAEQ